MWCDSIVNGSNDNSFHYSLEFHEMPNVLFRVHFWSASQYQSFVFDFFLLLLFTVRIASICVIAIDIRIHNHNFFWVKNRCHLYLPLVTIDILGCALHDRCCDDIIVFMTRPMKLQTTRRPYSSEYFEKALFQSTIIVFCSKKQIDVIIAPRNEMCGTQRNFRMA